MFEFLDNNPDALDRYVREKVMDETLVKWCYERQIAKNLVEDGRKISRVDYAFLNADSEVPTNDDSAKDFSANFLRNAVKVENELGIPNKKKIKKEIKKEII